MEIKRSDIKFYRHIHKDRMKAQGEKPVSYEAFTRRLKKMTLHDAIYSPRVESQVRDQTSKTPIQDSIRRKQVLKEENIQLLDLDELIRIEKREQKRKPKNRVNMKPKKKVSRLTRFISLFR